jgi:hypothetical protein
MTGIVRRTTLIVMAGLLAASAALAQVPDPARSTCGSPPGPPDPHRREFVKVVGFQANGSPDEEAPGLSNGNVGARSCLTYKDFNGNPVPGAPVEIDFSDCCDINLCADTAGLVSCTPPIIGGITDENGVFCYTATGSAKDDGVYEQPNATNGFGGGCVEVRVAGVVLCRQTAIAYDQDGAVGPGNPRDGVDFTDVSVVQSLIIANLMTALSRYRGRADYDCSGVIDFVDRSFCQTQVARAAAGTGSARGCADIGSSFCTVKVPGPNCP